MMLSRVCALLPYCQLTLPVLCGRAVHAGTYAGMIERLDYLASLGVNAVELLPVQEFNELEYYSLIPGSDPPEYRVNFWGYSTVGYFAPMSRSV